MRGDGGDIYWRRRMSVLVAVLVVVAVVAWACSSGGSGPERTSSAQSSPSASGSTAAKTTPAVDPLLAGLRTLAMGTASPSPTPTPKAAPSERPRRPGEPCEEKDLVLSLQGGREEIYAGDARPTFLVTLVNTGSVMCKADVGPRAMEIKITSGADRIWSTADCVSGPGTEVKELQRGCRTCGRWNGIGGAPAPTAGPRPLPPCRGLMWRWRGWARCGRTRGSSTCVDRAPDEHSPSRRRGLLGAGNRRSTR
ncbi:hypothetical protein ACFQQB_22350 [Nonomuraea rubra]|uniref:hypothetical protein n=1 Tax=Nonomuraea rubra TaxID=46180 RepID=UPI003605E0DE